MPGDDFTLLLSQTSSPTLPKQGIQIFSETSTDTVDCSPSLYSMLCKVMRKEGAKAVSKLR